MTSARASARRREGTLCSLPAPVSLLLAVLGGALAFLAFPPFDLWPLMPVGIGMLTVALTVRSRALGALAGLAWGIGLMLPLTNWADIYAGVEPWLALALVEALYSAVYGLVAREVIARRGLTLRSSVALALLFAATELARATFPWGGLSWGNAAFTLQSSPLLSLGPWVGITGLSLVVAWLGQLLALGAMTLLGRRGNDVLRGVWPIALAMVMVLGAVVVPRPTGGAGDAGHMRIAGIQGSTRRITPATLDMPTEIFPHSLDETAKVAARARSTGRPLDLVVWPEDSTAWDAPSDSLASENLRRAAQDVDAPLLVGGQVPSPGNTRENLSMLWTAQGGPRQTYAKRHPVPFGEYIPARSFFRRLSDKVDLVSTDMRAGTKVGVMDIGGRKVGVLICFEIAYEDLVQDVVTNGSRVIVVQTNTALFGDSYEAVQQLAQSRVFAAVTDRSVVQVATTGPSAIVDPDGRILSRTQAWTQGSVVADVPLRSTITPAVAAGPWISIGIAALAVAALALALTVPAARSWSSPRTTSARRSPARWRASAARFPTPTSSSRTTRPPTAPVTSPTPSPRTTMRSTCSIAPARRAWGPPISPGSPGASSGATTSWWRWMPTRRIGPSSSRDCSMGSTGAPTSRSARGGSAGEPSTTGRSGADSSRRSRTSTCAGRWGCASPMPPPGSVRSARRCCARS